MRSNSCLIGETVNHRYKAKPLEPTHAENSIPEAAILLLNIWWSTVNNLDIITISDTNTISNRELMFKFNLTENCHSYYYVSISPL